MVGNCDDISFVESPPPPPSWLQSSQNMLEIHFPKNNFPPNLSRFEFKFTADINRKTFEYIENIWDKNGRYDIKRYLNVILRWLPWIQCDNLWWQIIRGEIFPLLIMVSESRNIWVIIGSRPRGLTLLASHWAGDLSPGFWLADFMEWPGTSHWETVITPPALRGNRWCWPYPTNKNMNN